MVRNLSLLSLLIVFSFSIKAQEIHSPAEIVEIMEKSELSYELAELSEEIEEPNRSFNLNLNTVYREDSAGFILTKEYEELSEDAAKAYRMAEKHFQNGNIEKAREKYQEVLELAPEYYKVMTYIGQTYGMEGD